MQAPPPPSPTQQQADRAQRARYAAETAILALFGSVEVGGGGGEDEQSILHGLKIAAILAALTSAIVLTSFRRSGDSTASVLVGKPDPEQISEALLSEAQSEFSSLLTSDLTDEQRAVLWATWAHSRVSDEIASAVNRGEFPNEFTDRGMRLKKIWISRSDAKVRPLHVKLHGKSVPVDADFWRWPETGQRLRWPGDRQAPPDATIGCRCVCLLSWANQDAVSETIRRITEQTEPDRG